ncbi:MAG: T9SS type A sorting domain-containing protein [Bacteroidetes bacterium]|nr:T9SS type A sorting domain-containing protein [Bacteroidota bacterium]
MSAKTFSLTFFILTCLFISPIFLFSQAGKDGAAIISTTGVIFNRYSAVTASAVAGTNTITVNNISDLAASKIAGASNNPYATSALGYGDLIMIIKMQGATIDITNTTSYGTISAYNNAGKFELQVVKGVTGNVITFCNNLANTYNISATTERVQVVRIPRLNSLTINSGSSLTASAWASSGYTGGIVAVEVTGNASIAGSINADGIGFRGGVVDNLTTGPPGVSNYVNTSASDGGEKGEGIAGFEADYDALNGRYDRGAPANGGGGGVAHNSAGGGGANGGVPASWNGMGNPDNSGTNYSTAWDLEGGSFHSNTSSGGGRGGYSYGANSPGPITTAPGNTAWGGDNRRNIGGLGGRPLSYTVGSTLFLGGGGGAGDANNNAAQNGANGGGIIYLLVTGNLSGAGTITANGATAGNTISGNNDAPGGGGGGGAIHLNVQGSITGVTLNANGGAGGNQLITSAESEGPGGGGGGGFVAVTGTPSITVNVAGGANGTTTSTSQTAFKPNGATKGGAGTSSNSNTFVAAPALSCFALPLSLISFDAQLSGQGDVKLLWVTENESNMKDFDVLESNDATNWQSAAMVAATNNGNTQNYSFDVGTISQKTWFRLKMLNLDDTYVYSNILFVQPNSREIIYLNGNSLWLKNLPTQTKEVRIYNILGILVRSQAIGNQTNSAQIDISNLPKGMYYAIWDNGSSRTGSARFTRL